MPEPGLWLGRPTAQHLEPARSVVLAFLPASDMAGLGSRVFPREDCEQCAERQRTGGLRRPCGLFFLVVAGENAEIRFDLAIRSTRSESLCQRWRVQRSDTPLPRCRRHLPAAQLV